MAELMQAERKTGDSHGHEFGHDHGHGAHHANSAHAHESSATTEKTPGISSEVEMGVKESNPDL